MDYDEKYATLCALFEAIWLKRKDKDYYDIDLSDLPAMTSPQTRKLATFVVELLEKKA